MAENSKIARSFRQDFPEFVARAEALDVSISLGEGRRNGRDRVFWLDGYRQLTGYLGSGMYGDYGPRLDLVIVGGESGDGARVWDGLTDAARSLRDQCRAAGVAFFMKQMAGPRKATMPPIPADLMIRQMPGVQHG